MMDRFMIPKEPHEGEHFTFAVKGRYYTIQKGKEYVVREKGEWTATDIISRKAGYGVRYYHHADCPVNPCRLFECENDFCPNCGADMRKGENG